ncbi:hypothetical protein EY643_04080 [Halioglobus maricola]|uniref:Bacteriocin n=1 Tax=Halioglobus maricola TaxID=2601894 RepID=A0A5P9NGI3_9GAMM|nr:hypothetical protein [Halioglobus maricola]QFU74882.1 hypothetical protein EY643_04080 [Halioglobus maricola]
MNLQQIDPEKKTMQVRPLENHELTHVSGGGDTAESIAGGTMSVIAGTAAGAIGGLVFGGFAGLAIGAAIGYSVSVGYSLATTGAGGRSRTPVDATTAK